jgi:pyruvate/2-oxoglutarate dehydrogenase complex dihydrolipoamide dehydrogenase (E3) component
VAERYHTAVIGAGAAGLTVAVGLAKFGKRVALIERRHVGGDCTNVGCVPSKTLVHLADHLQMYGLSPAEVLARVRDKRDSLREEETTWVKDIENLSFIEGEARLIVKNRLKLTLSTGETHELEAKNLVLATGSRPVTLAIDGLPEARTLTNESLFELSKLPEHLAIIGAGIIGSEMAFAFRKLGSHVTLIDVAPRVLGTLEPEVSELMQEALCERHIDLKLGAKALRYDETTGTLQLEQGGQDLTLEGVDKVLLALGRKPNIEGLGLERLGLSYDKRGIPTSRAHQTNIAGVYALGDLDPISAFTHSANAQGRRVVRRLALPWLPLLSPEPSYPSAIFTDPEVATVGPTLAKLKERYHPELLKTLRVDLKETDKGYTEGLTRGFVLIHAMRLSGRVLSATIVAPKASEMISLLTLVVNKRLSLYTLSGLVYPYPVLSEGIKKAADGFLFETLGKLAQELGGYLRYRFAPKPKKRP